MSDVLSEDGVREIRAKANRGAPITRFSFVSLCDTIDILRAQIAAARADHAKDLREIAERMDHFATAASDLNRQQMYAELRRQLANVRVRLAAIEGGGT